MQVTIRPALDQDRAAIIAASEATWAEHRARQPHAFAENGWDVFLAREHVIAFRDPKGRPVEESGNLFVADGGGHVLGYILLSWHLRADASDYPDGTIIDIWVDPDWRGKGVGAALVDFAKARADEADWDNLTATVWQGAPSKKLFAEAGFTAQSTTYRHGPDRSARPVETQAAEGMSNARWKWLILACLAAAFAAIAVSGR
ncbi:GNAT family N-acetyltransferase [Gymnodinialimonas sp. 2305UL16-5]|uniref:GNAT family N-acetyltransferase n=1 Tax=Gymnodinialimonas mytili TaxID=3126503 RepID=UPI0030AF4642